MDDWKSIEGLTIPLQRKNKQNGEETSQVEYKKIEINPAVDPKIFEKPAEKAPDKQ
jgi:outer membrane lipoprotein-sorting protein